MSSGLPVSSLISVSVSLSSPAAQGFDFGTELIVGDSNVINVTERVRSYSSIADIATDFGTTAQEYLAALLFFSQVPKPGSLLIGRWAQAATAGLLSGGPALAANQLLAAWTAITTGAFFVTVNGIPLSITGLNFSAATNLNGVAAVIQTALAAASAASTCVWNSTYTRFTFTSGTTGVASTVSFLEAPTATGFIGFAGQPANNDTITLNGTVVTFVTGAPSAGQVQIAGTAALTIAALQVYCAASLDAQLVKFEYTAAATKLYLAAVTAGAGGNALTLAKAGVNLSVSAATLSGGTGVDISAMLAGLSTSSGAYVANGIAAESALAALTAIDGMRFFYTSTFASTNFVDADALACAAYIEADAIPHMFGVNTNEGAAIISPDTTSIGAQLKVLGYNRTFTQYSSTSAYPSASIMGRMSTVNFNASNSTINLMFQQEPGVVAESLTLNQASALNANNYNYFAAFNNNTSILVNGKCASGVYIDEVFGADWLANSIQTNVYNLLYTNGKKIPQTDAGMNLIATQIEAACAQAVVNGFLAPGTWTLTGFGQLQTGQFMPKGYYVYSPPISSQSVADRAARKSVAFQVAGKTAGAVNSVAIAVNINQ